MTAILPPSQLVGARRRGAVRRRPHAALRQPRLRGQHAGDGRRVGRGRGVRAVVLAASTAAPARSRGSRPTPTRRRAGASRASSAPRTAASSSSATRPRRSTSSPARCRRARRSSPPRSSTTRTCSRGAITTCACCRSRRRPSSCSPTPSARCRRHRPARRHRRVQRHRRGVAARAARRSSRTRTAPSCSSTPPSSRRTARSTWPRPASTTSRCPATSSTRRSAPARSSAARPLTGQPLLQGGGAIKLVTVDDVIWADAPERFEAGSPNVIGAVALAAACDALDMEAVEAHERLLGGASARGPGDDRRPHDLRAVARPSRPGRRRELQPRRLQGLRAGGDPQRRARDRRAPRLLLRAPAADPPARRPRRRGASACTTELQAGRDPELPGAVRASLGVGTTTEDIDALIAALTELR